jgi:mono/diheme cytochrome c family protein
VDGEFGKLVKELEKLKREEGELVAAAARTPARAPALAVAPPSTTPLPAPPKPEPVAIATVPADRPFTSEDVVRGRELFLGHQPLANGGTACITCHAIHGCNWPEGGRLGPELTKVYERVGGRTGLIAHLWAHATPLMQPAFQQHGLESEEVLALTAYLEDTDRHEVEDTSPFPLRFLLMGLGGTVLGLATVGTFWFRKG